MMDKPVTLKVFKDGKVIFQFYSHPDQGRMWVAPGGVEYGGDADYAVAIPKTIEIDEISVEWD